MNLGIAFSVLQEIQQEATRLLGPATLSTTNLVLVGHSLATNAAVEATERNNILVLNDIVQELLGLAQKHALESLGCFTGVLQANTKWK
jgi:hypothetical protein